VALSKPHVTALTRFNRRMQELQEDNIEDMAIKSILLKNIDKLAKPIPLAPTNLNVSVMTPGIQVLQYRNRRTILQLQAH
jgi:hypothetical protein